MIACWEGFAEKEHNRSGHCCCNCHFQRPIMKHPWNEDPLVKGSIMERAGWGCAAPDFFPHIMFFDREHSLCECHKFREWEHEST
jgi:hypothetical protein